MGPLVRTRGTAAGGTAAAGAAAEGAAAEGIAAEGNAAEGTGLRATAEAFSPAVATAATVIDTARRPADGPPPADRLATAEHSPNAPCAPGHRVRWTSSPAP